MKTCVISGAALGSMGEPAELVAAARLVRFCCEACIPTFLDDPQRHLSALRSAEDRGKQDVGD